MNADIGDMVHIHGRTVGAHDRIGRIVEVRGPGGSPPYLVRFEDGHEALIFPGPDCVVEHLVTHSGRG
ncbi:DUF1918 domain-containing protein [Peterkaempfera griseoplana]|uniref:DUF1918 domain-containing protein n=1 Tax=Peterkaempfera griseoplana TaxID=66896 RepID=UPI0006E1809A|nr:DUF1918 domain-containing protein [Peterkaempfera griseoplana]